MADTPPASGRHAAVLAHMLDRLYAALMSGPGLNCRPHRSRQRVDLTNFAALGDAQPVALLHSLLETGSAKATASVTPPPGWAGDGWFAKRKRDDPAPPSADDEPRDDADAAALQAFRAQRTLLKKLSVLADEARTYLHDTGVHALHVGLPLLSVPAGYAGGDARRVLGPVAFVPVSLDVRQAGRATVTLSCVGEGVERVQPNPALLAWVERQTGRTPPEELFTDEEGSDPWRELAELVRWVAGALEIAGVDADALMSPEGFDLIETPRTDGLGNTPAVLPAAVLGLFPAGNQGLVRDTREMLAGGPPSGPVRAFVESGVVDEAPPVEREAAEAPRETKRRRFADERFVGLADPCQSRAARRARHAPVLVLHGPPGTGKSQTITNMIGDHLAAGQRVLFVSDKRTALDVVANRLNAAGLDGLCAVVHDAARDQRPLYLKVRAQLEALSEARDGGRADAKLDRADAELQQLHDELWELYDAVMGNDAAGRSFHEQIGRWLSLKGPALPGEALRGVTWEQVEQQRAVLEVALERGHAIGFGGHPWAQAAGGTVSEHLARPADATLAALQRCVETADAADATLDDAVPPFNANEPLAAQAQRRAATLDGLRGITDSDRPFAALVAGWSADEAQRRRAELDAAGPARAKLATGPLDPELQLTTAGETLSPRALAEQLGAVEQYLAASGKWYGFLAFGAKSAAGKAMKPYGLPRTRENAGRLRTFLDALRARLLLTTVHGSLTSQTHGHRVLDDATLATTLDKLDALLALRQQTDPDPALAGLVRVALDDAEARQRLITGLERSAARASALRPLEDAAHAAKLFDPGWLAEAIAGFRAGEPAAATFAALRDTADRIEDVLRVREAVAQCPGKLGEALETLVKQGVTKDEGLAALEKQTLAEHLAQRLRDDPRLARLDPAHVERSFERIGELEEQKRKLVRDAVLDRWRGVQRQRLLVGTGSRLNAAGASLRQRLFVRGQKAMRLRQMLAVGRSATYEDAGGDPLFDVCPVWLCSPETVAQVFPREAIFDVVVFDEASQVRLEDALPVLTRAKRVVIAGDTKQLPPTRFFEAALQSTDDAEIETEDQLFEQQQAGVEDLLAAALNLSVEETFLDVHYRSHAAELIAFSNAHFYGGRLQALPGLPAPVPPALTLVRADGTYTDRTNEIEARRIVELIDALLREKKPPSIGVGCFNLAQRDLIVEMLEERAAEDEAFGKRLAAARALERKGSFEGLFVKNLENVQGDERDHLIISTTYGPNEEGKFYRRFGPLAMPGGGRRLNVLVTRARQKVWVVTSIPAEQYRALEPVPAGSAAGGGWLLMAYLRYAEQLGQTGTVTGESPRDLAAGPRVHTVRRPSAFAAALAEQLADDRRLRSEVFFGNDGFCVDVAVHGSADGEGIGRGGDDEVIKSDVTAGVLCDFSRYDAHEDPVEWDVYRTGMLRVLGWPVKRLWTPRFFRDPAGETRKVVG